MTTLLSRLRRLPAGVIIMMVLAMIWLVTRVINAEALALILVVIAAVWARRYARSRTAADARLGVGLADGDCAAGLARIGNLRDARLSLSDSDIRDLQASRTSLHDAISQRLNH